MALAISDEESRTNTALRCPYTQSSEEPTHFLATPLSPMYRELFPVSLFLFNFLQHLLSEQPSVLLVDFEVHEEHQSRNEANKHSTEEHEYPHNEHPPGSRLLFGPRVTDLTRTPICPTHDENTCRYEQNAQHELGPRY